MPALEETSSSRNQSTSKLRREPAELEGDVPSWQSEMASAIKSVGELCSRLQINVESASEVASANFPVFVPESFLKRMATRNPCDPLLKQVLPTHAELKLQPNFLDDPVGDLASQQTPGILHKYQGRALLIVTGKCAIHCRYCFRKEFPYEELPKSIEQWDQSLQYIEQDPSIHEVIFSGGDPLVLSDERFAKLVSEIEVIDHVKRLRIHSRLPIVLPSRVTDRFIESLQSTRLQVFMVVHANHAQELQSDCAIALKQLVQCGVPVQNQAVLLKGVNDDIDALTELCETCINLGVIPYYLHQLDRVTGSAHFEVDPEVGLKLITELRKRLPGYAVPKYVIEQPGALSKTPVELFSE